MAAAPEWQKELCGHPIFQPSQGSLLEQPSCLLSRGDDLLVVMGNEIRALSIQTYQAEYYNRTVDLSTLSKYTRLVYEDNADLGTILQTSLNSRHSLLALSTTLGLFVLELPSIIPPHRPSFSCPGHAIHASMFGSKSKSLVSHIDWHPHSLDDSHLLVLTMDGMMRMYDVLVNTNHPELCICLSKNKPHRDLGKVSISPSFAFYENPPVSFVVPKDSRHAKEDPWLVFCLFVVFRDGQLSKICPLLPRACKFHDRVLSGLEALLKEEAARLSSALLSESERQFVDYEIEWIRAFVSACSPSDTFAKHVVLRPEAFKLPMPLTPIVQGPIRKLPGTELLDAQDEMERVLKIHLYHFSASEKLPDLLALAYDTGRLDVYDLIERSFPLWSFEHHKDFDKPSVHTAEIIQFPVLKEVESMKRSAAAVFYDAASKAHLVYCNEAGCFKILLKNVDCKALEQSAGSGAQVKSFFSPATAIK